MKKVITVSILIGLFSVLVAPLALAQQVPATSCTISSTNVTRINSLTGWSCSQTCDFTTPVINNVCSGCCLMSTIYTITDWIFFVLVALSAIMILLGAFSILTAGGNAEKVTAGRNYIMYAAIGLVVGLLARAIPALARLLIGV